MTDQRSHDWYKTRLGKITASEFGRLRTAKTRQTYAKKLRHELTLLADLNNGTEITLGPAFQSKYTDWGIKSEPLARAEYELRNDCDLVLPTAGFIVHPNLPFVGCSPDGLLPDNDGGIEIKCPYKTNIHLRTKVTGNIPDEHRPQVQGVIWVCDLDWLDFVSYDPRLDYERQYFQVRIYRDEAYITQLSRDAMECWNMVNDDLDDEPVSTDAIPTIF